MTGPFLVNTDAAAVARRLRPAESAAVEDLAKELLRVAKTRVPVDDGELQNSGRVTVNGRKATVTFSSPYAVRQHEDLTAKHDSGRGAKFLEGPGDELRSRAADLLARALRAAQ